ncbi:MULTISPECIES: sensor domain-containing diguanylate cyclase [Pelosinus]|uniref:Diguanylate cyclase n=1 Tax=Pelosinus fermentans B4 TaxID=1149862 RepID=I9L7R3_9FIRM|nr:MULTISPECIES: sensor domain-containing diguanylate cyclase [Pelosinus]EIW16399.1 diguanylate cyclase [Pelosinus fermentans B4]EIW22620.1 diguanylate cyclase with Cache1 sensor [Pelosinus fermentans A11]OAM95706.1 diguanylate cyclase with integral membrane sensor [Pelosinus fermentans DSM 17108]SDR31820.1 diguanylate cyclase (GGDEF) domain-containing protein [Pelosinus fermentans]
MRFLHKFILLLCSLVIISSFIQFIAFDRFFLANTSSLLLATNEKAANNLSEQLLAYFKNIEASMAIIASDPSLRKDKELLDKINAVIPEVNTIFIIDKEGNVSVSSQPEKTSGVNLSKRDYFQHGIKGETYISGVYKSAQGREVVAISTPIIEDGTVVGVVVATVWLYDNKLAMMFDNKSFGRNGYIAITDQQGIVVYHSLQERIGKKGGIIESLQGMTGSTIMKNYSEIENYIGYSKVPQLDWYVIVGTPTAEITQYRNMMLYQILAVSIFTFFIVVIIGTYTVRRYMKPFETLIEAFGSVRTGNYKKIALTGYAAEFGEMIQSYNDTIRKLEEVHSTLKGAADIDALTGAYNRRSFDKIVELLRGELQAGSLTTLGVMVLDLDNFKKQNDISGHLAGDDILKEFTVIAQSIVGFRSLFRFGGDEFAIILRNVSDTMVISYAEEIRLQCAKKLSGCTVSIGVAAYPKNGDSIDELLAFADKALYMSKETRNKVTEYPADMV